MGEKRYYRQLLAKDQAIKKEKKAELPVNPFEETDAEAEARVLQAFNQDLKGDADYAQFREAMLKFENENRVMDDGLIYVRETLIEGESVDPARLAAAMNTLEDSLKVQRSLLEEMRGMETAKRTGWVEYEYAFSDYIKTIAHYEWATATIRGAESPEFRQRRKNNPMVSDSAVQFIDAVSASLLQEADPETEAKIGELERDASFAPPSWVRDFVYGLAREMQNGQVFPEDHVAGADDLYLLIVAEPNSPAFASIRMLLVDYYLFQSGITHMKDAGDPDGVIHRTRNLLEHQLTYWMREAPEVGVKYEALLTYFDEFLERFSTYAKAANLK